MARHFLPLTARVTVAACRPRLVRQQLVRWSDQRLPGLWGTLLCRKRYGDDQFALALRLGIRQVVTLGASLDTRPYRHLAEPRGRTFEVDLPSNSTYKQRRLRAIFGRVPGDVVLIPLDFESEDLNSSLAAHGYRSDQPTLFVWEAVTQYLTESAVRRALTALSSARAPRPLSGQETAVAFWPPSDRRVTLPGGVRLERTRAGRPGRVRAALHTAARPRHDCYRRRALCPRREAVTQRAKRNQSDSQLKHNASHW